MNYVPLPVEDIQLNTPVPVNIWDARGQLLLRRGEVIESERHRENLLMHGPMVRESDYRAWTYSYTMALDRMVRSNETLNDIAVAALPSELVSAEAVDSTDPCLAWPDLQAGLAATLHQNISSQDFTGRLTTTERRAQRLLELAPDDALFMLVQLLYRRELSYTASHALLSAACCHLVAPVTGVEERMRAPLFHAALTMNLGMAKLQDDLCRQEVPVSELQRNLVREHPRRSVELLRQSGVEDADWLRLVADHHEAPDGSGYPEGKRVDDVATQLLRLTDVFVARISPRRSREGLTPQEAARNIYLDASGQPSVLGAAFVKTLGIYPPGSYVRLANDEVAVVLRRGRRANAPRVASIVGRQGLPLGEPALRDTSERNFEVKGSVASDEVRVVLSPAKLLARL